MAFDQHSIPKSLRPLNIVQTVVEDPRIAPPVTSTGMPVEGFYANPSTDLGGSPGSNPSVYYPAAVPDAGFVNLGLNNAVPGVTRWVQNVIRPPLQPGVLGPAVNSTTGYTCAPYMGTRGVGSEHASDEGGDDSVSGRKVKFLCSFGGKILPRPSDGNLRYVGGQTRIISMRRGASFGELVQKMTDICGQNVVIKYQLPEEELDALVSVSGPDDLENMMDEYEKLIERSSDGSSKLRIFLFSPSEIESPVPIHIGDYQDGGQKYVEAVNGIMDGLGVAGQIARKGSIESAASAQNSDLSVTEGAESSSPARGEAHALPFNCGLPVGNPGVALETNSRMMYADPNPAPHIDPSAASLSIPMAINGPMPALGPSPEQEVERHVPLTAPHSVQGMAFPAAPYMQTYVDSHRETLNPASYLQLPSQMGFPTQILQAVAPVYTQQPIPTVALPQQFPPSIHMTMNPSIINPSAVPSMVKQRQVRVEHYPAEHAVAHRVVQLPPEQGHSAHHAQTSSAYNWHIPHSEQINISEGGLPPQPVLVSEVIPRFEECYMCQKALPHAHSDTIAHEQKESPLSTLTDSRSVYRSLHLDDRGHVINKPAVTGPLSEGFTDQVATGALPRVIDNEDCEIGYAQTEGSGVLRKFEEQNMDEKTIHQKLENPEHSKVAFPLGMMATSAVQPPFGMLVTNTPQPMQANSVQPQRQVIQGSTISMPLNNDFVPVGCMPLQTSDDVFGVPPDQFATRIAVGNPRDDSPSSALDHLRQIDGRLENLHIRPSEILVDTEQVKSVNESREKDILEAQQRDGTSRLPRVSGDKDTFTVEGNSSPSMCPSSRVGEIPDNSASLFSNQDPWNLRLDSHFPPPRPNKLIRENAGPGNYLNPVIETPLDNAAYPPRGNLNPDFNLNQMLSNKVESDELIKQELQAVAEGVVASVLHSPVSSNPDLLSNAWNESSPMTQQNGEVQPAPVEMQQRDKFEEIKAKLPEKINVGFPRSDGMGRLQIIKNSDLEELRELGSGTFGTVYHGKWRGTDVAIKRINDRCFAGKPSEQERMRDDFWNEAIKLADLHHPNVVAFYGVVLDGPDGTVATVTEYMVNGSLRNALQKSERILDKRKRLLISMDVAFGMEYLHAKNIVHFDLKSDNLLVNLRDPHRPICKVGDLGLSKVKCQTLISGGVRGTLPWMAPELLNGSSSLVSDKVDVFSFGIVMWELLTGEEPYADLHYGAIIGGIVSNTLRPPVPEPCDPDWRDLMERCWSSEPSERPNFTEIADELRAIAAKLPPKGQQQVLSTNSQVKS
ncbi:Kinase superfamily protein with octicosapeptide/Phox/Bem1p domain isoform 1 [Dorcoceras hygrometricum]|nr:Kinase superfamily protein with octicosapeptide/Phox/Bem1p domain isoform 1 [Dorcoceras hygrometricum]